MYWNTLSRLHGFLRDHPYLDRPRPVALHSSGDTDSSASDNSDHSDDGDAFDAGAVIQAYQEQYLQLMSEEWEVSELTLIATLHAARGDVQQARRWLAEDTD